MYGFRYAWDNTYLNIKKDEYVLWTWQPPVSIDGLKFKVQQVIDATSTGPIGFTSGEPSEFGSFKYQFTTPGIYYYWSGYVDVNRVISFRGVIEVIDQIVNEKEFTIDVKLDDIYGILKI